MKRRFWMRTGAAMLGVLAVGCASEGGDGVTWQGDQAHLREGVQLKGQLLRLAEVLR